VAARRGPVSAEVAVVASAEVAAEVVVVWTFDSPFKPGRLDGYCTVFATAEVAPPRCNARHGFPAPTPPSISCEWKPDFLWRFKRFRSFKNPFRTCYLKERESAPPWFAQVNPDSS
jgi:hypothetical protein